MSYIDDVYYLNDQLWTLKNSRTSFMRHVRRLIYKIHETIENFENTEKVLFLVEQLNVIFVKLKDAIFNSIELWLSPEEIENANEILCDKNSELSLSKTILNHNLNLQNFKCSYL